MCQTSLKHSTTSTVLEIIPCMLHQCPSLQTPRRPITQGSPKPRRNHSHIAWQWSHKKRTTCMFIAIKVQFRNQTIHACDQNGRGPNPTRESYLPCQRSLLQPTPLVDNPPQTPRFLYSYLNHQNECSIVAADVSGRTPIAGFHATEQLKAGSPLSTRAPFRPWHNPHSSATSAHMLCETWLGAARLLEARTYEFGGPGADSLLRIGMRASGGSRPRAHFTCIARAPNAR